MNSAFRQKFVFSETSSRMACKKADAADAQREKHRQEAHVQAQLAAVIASDDECRSAEESTSCEVAALKQKLAVAERAEAKARAARDKSCKAKTAVDRKARERSRTVSSPPAHRIPDRPLVYELLPFDFAFMTVSVNVLAKHRQGPFTATHPKSVSWTRNALMAHMEDFLTGTLQLILTGKSASFVPSTVNAACGLLFTLRVPYSRATTTLHWPKHIQVSHGSDTDRRGRPPTKRGCRSPDARTRRDSRGDGSSLRST